MYMDQMLFVGDLSNWKVVERVSFAGSCTVHYSKT